MPEDINELRETDFRYIKRQLKKLYRKRRTAETHYEFQQADKHVRLYQEFLADNQYPKFTESDDLKS